MSVFPDITAHRIASCTLDNTFLQKSPCTGPAFRRASPKTICKPFPSLIILTLNVFKFSLINFYKLLLIFGNRIIIYCILILHSSSILFLNLDRQFVAIQIQSYGRIVCLSNLKIFFGKKFPNVRLS